MHFLRKALQLIRFLMVNIDMWFGILIYKHFKRNHIIRNEEDISGKCVVMTGGSSGIGRSSAREFARRGATVVIGDVDLENGRKVVEEIQEQTGNMNVTILELDLADMDSVEQFARTVSKEHPKIKILLNNAGIGGSKDENIKTKDGFNIHVAVNYMGHFLLTNLLMKNLIAEKNPRCKESPFYEHYILEDLLVLFVPKELYLFTKRTKSIKFAPGESNYRIVSTTSSLLLISDLNIDDLNMDRSGFGLMNSLPYCNTKFCLVLFTRALGMRCGVNSYALCPGSVNTAIMNSDDTPSYLKLLFRLQMSTLANTADEAASEFIMYCALERSIKDETGRVYRYRKPFHQANKKLDDVLAKRLWDKSSELVQLDERMARVKCKECNTRN